MENYVITISRKFSSNGHAIARRLGELLSIPVYDRSAVEARVQMLGQDGLAEEEKTETVRIRPDWEDTAHPFFSALFRKDSQEQIPDEARIEFDMQAQVIRSLAKEGPCIILGRCGDQIFREEKRHLNVFIYASEEKRIQNSMDMLHTDRKAAKALILQEDRVRENYRKRFAPDLGHDTDGRGLLIDSGLFGVEKTALLLAQAATYLFLEN